MSAAPSAPAIEPSAAFDILQTCRAGAVPANADLDAAIVAHKMAFRDGREIAAYALRALVCATTRTREQAQRRVDYLTALPIEAWEGVVSGEPATIRDETLALCRWLMTSTVEA